MEHQSFNPPYHVLMVTNTLARGGAESMLVQLALALNPKIIKPVVICLKEAGSLAEVLNQRSIPIHTHQLHYKYDFRVIARLSQLIEQYAPACMMAVGSGGDRMFWPTLAARRAKAPMIVWSHMFPTPDHLYFEWTNRRLYRDVNAFVALGDRHCEALIELEHVPAHRTYIIRNGIDVTEFDCPHMRPQARNILGLNHDDTVAIGIIANLRPDKRHDLFIEAAAQIYQARRHSRFYLIGDGSEHQSVERLVRKHDPENTYITMLGERDDLPTVMQGLDVVCLTSQWHECLSIAMLEAMSAGKVFVAPRVGSLDEALIDGQTGRFFEPPTAQALAEVLIELIDDAQQRKTLGERARNKMYTEFTIEKMAREFESLLTDLLHKE